MSIPNLITLSRLLSVPLIIYLILNESYGWAFALFLLAGASDALDGYIAKALDQTTTLGVYLDPLADKALIVSVYVTLGMRGLIDDFVVILVVFRDVLIVGGVLLLLVLRRHWEARPVLASKVNTGVQIFLAAAVLAEAAAAIAIEGAIELVQYAVIATTVGSGGWYLVAWARKVAGADTR
ncbi:MAG: CDP-alcohol phosphatidyltransferase family protein [Defluviicoccus sp.]|nr:CDP-alcohol phosphatidyltransferase family protein [Defluviicoccus sp.]MDE0384257.1 CDP-alcohol phosphatidyltransferase family protein [Defluviicoccus sp.]